MNYKTVFTKKESQLFELLQDALTKGLSGVSYADAETVLGIKQKINAHSRSAGEFCVSCGTILKRPGANESFYRVLDDEETVIIWHSTERTKILEVLDGTQKRYALIESYIGLIQTFKNAESIV